MPLLGIYLEKTKTLIPKDTCTPMSIAALFTIAKTWKQPKCPSTDEWIKKKKNEILPFVTMIDLEGIMLSAIRQMEKDKYHTISLTCGIYEIF